MKASIILSRSPVNFLHRVQRRPVTSETSPKVRADLDLLSNVTLDSDLG